MQCAVLTWDDDYKEPTVMNRDGKEVCTSTRAFDMSLEGFAEIYARQKGQPVDEVFSKIAGSYDDDVPEEDKESTRVRGFKIRSKGKKGQRTLLINAKLENEINDLVTLNYRQEG